MCLPSWRELLFDPKMDACRIGLEPAAASHLKMRGFGHARDAEQACIEGLSLGLSTGWHSQLNVVKSCDGHELILAQPNDTEPFD